MKKLSCALAASAIIALTPTITSAQETTQDSSYISLGLGMYDAFRAADIYDNVDFSAMDFRIEYRSKDIGLPFNLKPWAGLEFTSDSSKWLGGGLLYDWRATENIIITPNAGVGLYDEGSSKLDLDGTVEFRLQLEAAYEFKNKHRLGLAVGHISNADTADRNPGTEIVNLYYHIPFNGF